LIYDIHTLFLPYKAGQEQWKTRRNKKMISRELYLKKIRPFMDKDIVKVMTGIRRCGKSVMLKLIQRELEEKGISREQILTINFESRMLPCEKNTDAVFQYVREFAEKTKKRIYLFFDEIQDLAQWEELVNALQIDFDVDIYITGSNAKLLSGELSTYLGGRYVEIRIYPFSYGEILEILRLESSPEVFLQYLTYGGMPFIYQNRIDNEMALLYLEDVFDSIILKDITQRNQVRDVGIFKTILLYLVAGVGTTFSASSIQKYLKSEKRGISAETLYNYLEYCKDACILHMVPRSDIIGKKLLQFQEKPYLTDHGFREAVYGNNQRDIQQILENIVYMELIRRGYTVSIGKNSQMEVDFVAERGSGRFYVQVAYLLADDTTIKREFGALESIPDNFPKYVVTMDEINQSRNGIKHVNIRKFLLMADYE
jgi:hypothetical protein